ncbi:MAG: hypothetical protein HC826_02525 [Rhodospirillales bacterium]|nr:hypothetical protein [Rhodospirillales bacterium]
MADAGTPPEVSVLTQRPMLRPEHAFLPTPRSFAEVVEMAGEQREMLLHGHLVSSVRLVKFEAGHISLALESAAPPDLPQRLSRFLNNTTGRTWMVTVSTEPGLPSLREQSQAADAALRDQVLRHPTVAAVMESFPGASINSIRQINRLEADVTDEQPEDEEGQDEPEED